MVINKLIPFFILRKKKENNKCNYYFQMLINIFLTWIISALQKNKKEYLAFVKNKVLMNSLK